MSSFNENENLNNEQTTHAEPSVSTVEPSTDIQSSFAGDQLVTGAEPPKKKRVFPIIAAAVVVLGAGAAAAYNFIPWVKNNARMLLSKPESYYSWVEEQNLAKTADDISSAYGDMLGADSPSSQEIEVKADLDSENLLKLIESSAGTSVSELGIKLPSSVAIKSSAAVNDGNTNGTCTITADDKSLITANVSIQDGNYYVKIPELSDAYISLDTAELMNEAAAELDSEEAAFMQSYMETITSLSTDPNALKELISENELHDMIVNYLTVIYEKVDDVELEKGVSCEVNGVKTEYNKLSAKISGKDAYKMIEDVLKEAKKDSTIIKLVEKFGGTKDEYKTAIDELLTDLSETEADDESLDEEITMNVFVDSKGKICGRSFESPDSDTEKVTLGYMTAEENEDTAFDVTLDINGESGFEILGKDENKGGKSSGEIKLIINNIDGSAEKYEIPVRYTDIEKTNENKGYCKGNISIDLSSFGIPSINLALDSDGKSQTITSDIAIAGTNYAAISVIIREENTVDIPTFDSSQKVYKITNDGAELEQYITEASVNVTALIDNVGSVFGVNGLGQLIMGFAADDQTSVNDPVFTPDVTTDDQILDNPNSTANVTYDFSKLNIQLNGQAITLPAKINGLLSYVTVEDQQLEANGFASYFSEDYSLSVNITNDSDAPAAPADCTVTGITVSEGSSVTFSIDGLTVGSSISDVAAKYGVPVPTEEYGSITIYDANSDWNDFTFYYYNGIVDSVSFDIFDY
ncbi:MAG: hypothetical protein NC320_10585 [Clostridium sp.]|nr:hypothetical protein [Clostridium sp.]MCM1547973.1 hypothetical protein [Ruminococcus sp.]